MNKMEDNVKLIIVFMREHFDCPYEALHSMTAACVAMINDSPQPTELLQQTRTILNDYEEARNSVMT